jgi:hypothetical protein
MTSSFIWGAQSHLPTYTTLLVVFCILLFVAVTIVTVTATAVTKA